MSNRPKIRFAPTKHPRVRIVGITPTGDRENYEWQPRDDAVHALYRARLQNQVDRDYSHLILEVE